MLFGFEHYTVSNSPTIGCYETATASTHVIVEKKESEDFFSSALKKFFRDSTKIIRDSRNSNRKKFPLLFD